MALKDAIRQRPAALEAALLARNAWLALPGREGTTARIGATHAGADVDAAVAYVNRVYEDYLRYGDIAPEAIVGARVLEVGPGDNLGVALRFIGGGAARVQAFERFHVTRDHGFEASLYEGLIAAAAPETRTRMEKATRRTAHGLELDPERISLVEGVGIEEAGSHLEPASIDLQVSRAVLEYVQEMDTAMAVMDDALRPGGFVAHKVDLRDHGLYTGAGHSPLAFLRRGPGIYGRMSTRTGIPNRWRESDYLRAFEARGYEASSLVTHLVGESAELDPPRAELDREQLARLGPVVDAERPALAAKFRHRSVRDLAVAGIFIRGRKSPRKA